MAGRVRLDDQVRLKGSNPAWLDRDKETRDAGGAAVDVTGKVSRHRAGVLPDWAGGGDDDTNDDDDAVGDDTEMPGPTGGKRRVVAVPAVIVATSSALQRPARVVLPPTLVRGGGGQSCDDASSSESDTDEDEIAVRRASARARLAARRSGAGSDDDAQMPVGDDDDGGAGNRTGIAVKKEEIKKEESGKPEASGSSSWETDTDASDSDEEGTNTAGKLLKPVFVSKAKRETLVERDRLEREADDDWASREAHKLKRATESKALAEIEVERETAIATAEETAEHSDVETDDELTDPAVEYQAWRLRELLRIKEDEHTREKMFGERETQEKIRRMSEDEKKAYFEANPDKKRETPGTCGDASKQAIDTPKPGFLQKYYHKGAFFQEASDDQFGTAETHEIYKRDFSGATGGDKGFDKKNLPKSMQVRGDTFGKMGQTKWTHLAAEDTSRPQHKDGGGGDTLTLPPRKHKGKEQSFEKPGR
eukprot:CAMPEP_0117632318 /NCGR_PEP_ID=MMETSP0802-20121206/4519_1 /TAXON_ID=38833 /ORGANISM="Micromonas sp., Strain CCMP2099" /LENGTH=478 /DNA_ID=CAMNT_0005436755 /DNA_START=74 /DNA_END=1510 /DNA_ORIENTATION=+